MAGWDTVEGAKPHRRSSLFLDLLPEKMKNDSTLPGLNQA